MTNKIKKALCKPEFLLFIIIYFSAAFFTEANWQTGNFVSRYFLTKAMVDDHSLKLTKYEQDGRLWTDKAIYKNNWYSDKPIGSSILMIPQYAIFGKTSYFIASKVFGETESELISVWFVLSTSFTLYMAIGFVYLYKIFNLFWQNKRNFYLTLLCFFGTLMFPFSTIGFGEMITTGFLLIGIFYMLRSEKESDFLYSGLFYGLACFVTNQTGLFFFPAFYYTIIRSKSLRPMIYFSIPWIVFVGLTLYYNYYLFGNFMTFPYSYCYFNNYGVAMPVVETVKPSIHRYYMMTFDSWKGIFFYSPFLVFSFYGAFKLFKEKIHIFIYLLSSFLIFFVFLSFISHWDGLGSAEFGMRYIIPAFPFLCVLAIFGFPAKIKSFHVLLIILSLFMNIIGGITSPHVTINTHIPLLEYNIPILFKTGPSNVISTFLYDYGYSNIILVAYITTGAFILFIAILLYIIKIKKYLANK